MSIEVSWYPIDSTSHYRLLLGVQKVLEFKSPCHQPCFCLVEDLPAPLVPTTGKTTDRVSQTFGD